MNWANSLLRKTMGSAAVMGMVLSFSSGVSATPLFTLEGQAEGARYESEAGLRLSVLDWAEQEQASSVIQAIQDYQADQDAEALQKALAEQPTLGYLFTEAATGYWIKYAYQEEGANPDNQRMVFLVTPALKTRNPMLWQESNNQPHPYTVVEMEWAEGQATVKTSLGSEVVVDEVSGNLELQDFDSAELFALMEDSTPYYLKQTQQVAQQ